MVAPIFSGTIVVMYVDVENPIFYIMPTIFVKVLPLDLCDGLESTTTSLN